MGDVKALARADATRRRRRRRRWRNRWRHGKGVAFEGGFRVEPREHLGPQAFPSREVAERRAADWLREFADVADMCEVTYVGAVEDPDRG